MKTEKDCFPLSDLDGQLIELSVPVDDGSELWLYRVSTIGRVHVHGGDRDSPEHISVGTSHLPINALVLKDWRFVRDYYILVTQ